MSRDGLWLGGGLALATAVISGISVYVAKFGTQAVPDPFVYTTARNLTVGIVSLVLLALSGRLGEVGQVSGKSWGRLALIALVGGSLPFLMFFWGLTLTSASTGSLIQKTQFLFVALFAVPLLGEKLGRWQIAGLVALALGIALQGPTTFRGIGIGEALILGATLLWAAESVLVRRTLREVSPWLAATARMAGGSVILVAALVATGRLGGLFSLDQSQVLWVVIPSVFLFGYVTTWYTALRHAPATLVTSVLSLGAPVTALLGALSAGAPWVVQTNGPLTQWSFLTGPILSTMLLVLGSAIFLTTLTRPIQVGDRHGFARWDEGN